MTAEGYQAEPLSDELERRIRTRIAHYRTIKPTDLERSAWLVDGGIAALEWVLREADALKQLPARFDLTCPDCGHVHQEDSECRCLIGGGRFCRCERKVTA